MESLALSSDLNGERFIDLPVAAVIRVIPESVPAVTVVSPSRVIHDRIKADACNGDRALKGDRDLVADVAKPIWPKFVFDARLGDKKRLSVAIIEFGQDLIQRSVFLMPSRDLSPARVPPLIMKIVV